MLMDSAGLTRGSTEGSPQVPTPKDESLNPRKDRLQGKKTLKVSGFLEEFEKDDIKKNIDIVELFAYFNVNLSKVGKNYKGLCPFHNDNKTPSLSVSREKGLFNCFGCGESGDAFDLVEKMQKVDFREALKFLKGFNPKSWKGFTPDSPFPALPDRDGGGKKPPENSTAVDSTLPESERFKDLNLVKNHFRKRLFEHPEALAYLEGRGFKTPGIYERFQIGFSDGSLSRLTGEKQKPALIEAGILNEKGNERFWNCIVFPVFDDFNQTVGFYGRDINDNSEYKHRYLKEKHRGVWNRKASKVYDEIILSECIIDGLSLIEAGMENVQSLYGANGLTDEHLETLKADRVKTVILALDNDEQGKASSEKYKKRLLDEGFKVKIIYPFVGKDWNDTLKAGKLDKEDLKVLIEQTAVYEAEKKPEETKPFELKEDGQVCTFQFTDLPQSLIYRIAGIKETSGSNMRVNIRAEYEGEKYFDNLDLYSARSRSSYALSLSKVFGLEQKRVEKDLALIVDYFDEARLHEKEKKKQGETVEMTEADRRAGLDFLQRPNLFQEIVQDMNVMGYVGEDLNKQLLYLCASSRILDDPVSVLILSESASGKSYLVDTVKNLMPPEDVVSVTSLSDQALNYIKDLTHKFLILGEAVHSDVIEHQIREMLSGKELSRLVTVKDEKTGKMESQIVRTPVIVSSVMSSTAQGVNPENASRCFVINTDESREQTRRIHEAQRQKYSLERHYEKEKIIPEIVRKHRAAQRLLRKVFIVNPFGKILGFPDNLMRTRRDNDRFLDLIACVCFLRQYQKPVKWEGLTEYIECDIEDYRTGYEIMVKGVLASSLLEIPKGAGILYEEIRRMVKNMADRSGIKPEEVSFIQRDIREYSKFNADSVKKYLKNLVDLEYIQLLSGRSRGTRLSYRLRKDEELEKVDLSAIPSPEEMAKLKSGENQENDPETL